jgi:hypothetical protein
MNPEATKTIYIIYGVLLVACLLLAIPGINWGRRQKVVIYRGKADLILSCVTLPVVVITMADWNFEVAFSWVNKCIILMLLSYSGWISYVANRSVGKTIVVMATKFVLVGLIAFCALLALEGLIGGLKAQKKREYEEALGRYIVGAIGAFGVYHLQKLIATFVRDDSIET